MKSRQRLDDILIRLRALFFWRKQDFWRKQKQQHVVRDKDGNPCKLPPGYMVTLAPDAPPARDNHGRPPPPREFLAHRPYYELPLLYRPRAYEATDTPVEAIYRIYEHILLDQNVNMRNELERFWYHNGTYGSSVWPVRDIPDPKDPDPERYACVAAVPRLLREAFNERIRLGLPRDAPSIFTGEMMDEWKARGTLEREQDPPWVDKVPRLSKELKIPYWDERSDAWLYPVSAEDKGLSPAFLDKNVLIVHPDIHFL